MNRDEAQELFNSFFQGKKRLLKYFGAERSVHWDYEFSQCDDEWAICGDQVVWGPGQVPGHPPIPLSADDCTYAQEIVEVYRTEDFTLVFMRLNMGGSDGATIFDNSKEQIPVED